MTEPFRTSRCRSAINRRPVTLLSVQLMDEQQTARFESACIAAGARFIGGVFACAAFAQYELTGAEIYYGLTPIDTRSTPADFMTIGLVHRPVPITVPYRIVFR